MRVVLQRVVSARVDVVGEAAGPGAQTVAAIGCGLLVLAGFEAADGDADLAWMSAKIARLRVFPDPAGVMNLSVVEAGGEILAVSQFTLFASTRKGNRPSWGRAAPPETARPLFQRFVERLEHELGRPVPSGVFGADMQIHLINDGPVTIAIDSREVA